MKNIRYFENYINNYSNDDNMNKIKIPFSKFDTILSNEDKDIIIKHHLEWCKQFKILKKLELESDYINLTKENIWIYSKLDKNIDNNIEYNIFLEISKKDKWAISLEIEYNLNNQKDNKYTQLNKTFDKNGLTYEQLMINLRKCVLFLEEYNEYLYNKYNFFVL